MEVLAKRVMCVWLRSAMSGLGCVAAPCGGYRAVPTYTPVLRTLETSGTGGHLVRLGRDPRGTPEGCTWLCPAKETGRPVWNPVNQGSGERRGVASVTPVE